MVAGNKVRASSRGIPNFDDSAGWALWRLSQILAEIAENQSRVAKRQLQATAQTGFEVSSAEGSTND